MNEDVFYLLYNLDFWGRVYFMYLNFNYLGLDMCCGVFEFVKGRLFGEIGLCWLKIYFVNFYGGFISKLLFDV